jgi:DNA-binding LytR/AlgR family response regulator
MKSSSKLSADDMVIVGEGYNARLICVGNISTIEVTGNDITVRVNGCEPLTMRRSLGYCKERLPRSFFTAGRHCLVNLAQVSKVNMAQQVFVFTMKDGTVVRISRLQSRVFRKEMRL